jgi:prophage antirepressor-like protein
MTTDLSLTNLFEGKPIRVLEQSGDIWIPLADITSAWGIDRSTPDNIINRNERVFEGMFSLVLDVTTNTAVSCLNERGLYLMMGKISAGRLKNEQAQESIIRFQRWVPELIQKYRKKEIVQVLKGPDYPGIIEKLKFVKELSGVTGWNLFEMQKEVMNEAKLSHLVYHIEPEKPVALPAPPKPKDYLTATDIGERCGKSAEEVHIWMYKRKPPLIIRDDVSGWRLTEYGKEFAEERAVELVGGTVVWRIKWKKDVLRLFNIHDHMEMD